VTPDPGGCYEIRASRSKRSAGWEHGRVGFKDRGRGRLAHHLYGISDEQMRARMAGVRPARRKRFRAGGPSTVTLLTRLVRGVPGPGGCRFRSSAPSSCSFVHGPVPDRGLRPEPSTFARPTRPRRRPRSSTGGVKPAASSGRTSSPSPRSPPQVWFGDGRGPLLRAAGWAAARCWRGPAGAPWPRVASLALKVTIQGGPVRAAVATAAAGGSFTHLALSLKPETAQTFVYLEQLTSALYLDGREDVDHYREVMNELSTQALTTRPHSPGPRRYPTREI